jgi:hypothetical protein
VFRRSGLSVCSPFPMGVPHWPEARCGNPETAIDPITPEPAMLTGNDPPCAAKSVILLDRRGMLMQIGVQPVDRMPLFDRLCRLLPSQFEEVLFRVGAPRHHLAPATEPQVRRVIDLFQWADSEDPDGLTVVRDAMRSASSTSRGR